MAITPQQATIGTVVRIAGQERSGIIGGEPMEMTILDNDEVTTASRVAVCWFDSARHLQRETLPLAVLELVA